jgi:hypothetical protein
MSQIDLEQQSVAQFSENAYLDYSMYVILLVISLNLVLAGLRLGLKNRQVGEKWISDDCSYLCKGL